MSETGLLSTPTLLWTLEAQAGSCPVRKTRPSARLQRIPQAPSPEIQSVFDGPNTRWKGFTLALLFDGIQTNPPRRKMLSLLNALITVEGPRRQRRTTFLQMSWRPFRRSTNKDGALSRRMRYMLMQSCTHSMSIVWRSLLTYLLPLTPSALPLDSFTVSWLLTDRAMWCGADATWRIARN